MFLSYSNIMAALRNVFSFDCRDSDCLINMDCEHNKIHKGEMYTLLSSSSFTAGQTKYFLFKTGSKEVHNIFSTQAAGEVLVQSWEGATTSNDGTPITIFNKNRVSSKTPLTLAFTAPTFTAISTELMVRQQLGGSGRTEGTQLREHSELILKPNTNYIAGITNTTNQTMTIYASVEFYEV